MGKNTAWSKSKKNKNRGKNGPYHKEKNAAAAAKKSEWLLNERQHSFGLCGGVVQVTPFHPRVPSSMESCRRCETLKSAASIGNDAYTYMRSQRFRYARASDRDTRGDRWGAR